MNQQAVNQQELQLSFGSNGAPTIFDQIALALAAESYGFTHFSAFDDLFFRPAWPTLFRVAQHSSRIGLGPSVVNPYLTHPALTGEYAAILEEIAPGRAYLGIGRGAFLEDLNVEVTRPLRTLREAIALIRHLWAGDDSPFEGEIFQLNQGASLHFPTPARDIPIMVGTWGVRGAQLSGELADELKAGSSWSVRYAQHPWGNIERGAAGAGRDAGACGLVLGPLTSVSEDRAAASSFARQTLVFYLPYLEPMPQYLGMDDELLDRIQARRAEGDLPAAAALIPDDLLGEFALYGDDDEGHLRAEVEAL